jgi:hypothetical protein
MKYEAAREKIKSGDLLAWSHRGWRSWYDIKISLVRMFTASEHAHIGVAWVVGGRVLVLEAVTPKVRIYPLSNMSSFCWIPGFISWSDEIENTALSYVGHEYSQWEALNAFFKRSPHPSKMQCAKYAAILSRITPNNITPSQLVQAALEQGGELTYVSM